MAVGEVVELTLDTGTSVGAPTLAYLKAAGWNSYANDAAFVAAKGSAAAAGDSYYNSTDDVLRVYDGNAAAWVTITFSNSLVQELETFYNENFETITDNDWDTGDNATFLTSPTAGNGGTTGTTDVSNTTSPLDGTTDLKYTMHASAGSDDDYIASPEVSVTEFHQQNYAILIFYHTYDGAAGDIDAVIYDVDNTTVLAQKPIPAASSTKQFVMFALIPDGVTQIRWGIHVQAQNNSKVLQIVNAQLTLDPTKIQIKPSKLNQVDTTALTQAGSPWFIGFTTEEFDDDSNITNSGSASSGTYTSTTYITVDAPGFIHALGKVYINDADIDAGEIVSIRLYVNGSEVARNRFAASASAGDPIITFKISEKLRVNAADKVSLAISHSCTGDLSPSNPSNLLSTFSVTYESFDNT